MLTESAQRDYLARIDRGLKAATNVAKQFAPGTFQVLANGGRDVITEVDRRVSDVLRCQLPVSGEG